MLAIFHSHTTASFPYHCPIPIPLSHSNTIYLPVSLISEWEESAACSTLSIHLLARPWGARVSHTCHRLCAGCQSAGWGATWSHCGPLQVRSTRCRVQGSEFKVQSSSWRRGGSEGGERALRACINEWNLKCALCSRFHKSVLFPPSLPFPALFSSFPPFSLLLSPSPSLPLSSLTVLVWVVRAVSLHWTICYSTLKIMIGLTSLGSHVKWDNIEITWYKLR